MSSLLEEIMGNGLRILLLGSYDKKTKEILHHLRKDLNGTFERYSPIPLLLENIDFLVPLTAQASVYTLIIERQEGGRGTAYILENQTKPVAIIDFLNEIDFTNKIGIKSHVLDFPQLRKLPELEKVSKLAEWADLIYFVRHLESTHGGELVELTYLIMQQAHSPSYRDPLKYEFFYKKGIEISTMIREIVDLSKIDTIEYNNYNTLWEKVLEITKKHISRLNSFTGRFNQFETM